MTAIRDILGELKQRNVVRVAGVYAVTTWGIFQICNTLLPVLGVPKWALTLIAVLMLAGFPIALIVAWSLEKGPTGIRIAPGIRPGEKPAFAVTDWLLLGAMVAIVGVTSAQLLGFYHHRSAADEAEAPAGIPAKSVAVLPFVNFSDARDGEFFADGLTEEVINSLAQMPQLKVAGRTSSFYFKGKNTDLREIGRKLGVAHVMEGSVRRDGDRVRVTVQLISVATGFHMWSQTYDRTLSDSLALQTEIANTVAAVLKTKLLPAPPAPAASSRASAGESYRLALVAQARLRTGGKDDAVAARQIYRRIISIDPNNAAGYAGYARSTMILAQNFSLLEFASAEREATQNIAKALSLDANSADAWIAKGVLGTMQLKRNSSLRFAPDTEAALKRALELQPRDPDAHLYYANLLIKLSRMPEALAQIRLALQTDPLNRTALNLSGNALELAGKLEEAKTQYRTLMALYPDFVDARTSMGEVLMEQGRLDEAEPWLRAAADTGDITGHLLIARLYLNLGLPEDAKRALLTMGPGPGEAIGQVAWMISSGQEAKVVPFSEAKLAETQDPFWRDAIKAGAIATGDAAKALSQSRIENPEFFLDRPQVGNETAGQAADAVYALQATGQVEQAHKLLAALLQATAPQPGLHQSSDRREPRIKAYAAVGDADHAIAELKGAIDDHFRLLLDVDHFMRLDRMAHTRSIQADPRFRALIAQVDADNARMRAKVLAARGGR